MVMLGWRSQEQASHLKRKFRNTSSSEEYDKAPRSGGDYVTASRPKSGKRRREVDGHVPQGLPDHFYNADGEVDLRQTTGEEALRYFQAQGIQLPIIPRRR